MKAATETDTPISPDQPPAISWLTGQIEQALNNASSWAESMTAAERTRFAIWDGQSDDGRKWTKKIGKRAFPWEGASDARIRLADEIVNEKAMVLQQAFFRSKFQTAAREPGDLQRSAATSLLLDHTVRVAMADHLRDEIAFLSNWRETYGLAVLSIAWEKQIMAEPKTMTLDGLTKMAVEHNLDRLAKAAEQAGQPPEQADAQEIVMASVDEVQTMFLDPANEDQTIGVIQQMTGVPIKTARRIVKDIRATGTADYHVPYVAVNRPRWTAKVPYVDVFFPPGCDNIQAASWVAETEWLSIEDFKSRAIAEEWDPAWVEKVIETKGKPALEIPTAGEGTGIGIRGTGQTGFFTDLDLHKDEVQIIHTHYRATGPDDLPALFRTCWRPDVMEYVGYHEMMPYLHGKMPFVWTRRDFALRAGVDSRGIPGIVATHQGEIKVQRDSRTDRTSMATLPPLVKPGYRTGQMNIGPGVEIPERRAGELKFMDPPRYDQGSIEMEQSTRNDVDRYFGRQSPVVPQNLSLLFIQSEVDNWLHDLTAALSQTLQLMQQFMDPQVMVRVTGTDQFLPVARDEIQGQWDITAAMDARDLDTEYLKAKLELISTIALPMDASGKINRGALVEFVMTAISPQLASATLLSDDAANEAETEGEKSALAMMAGGVEPVMPERSGMNHAVRLQTLQAAIQANPSLQARIQQDQVFQAMLDARVKFHQQGLNQEKNKIIGRLGAAPVTGV
jgi:hypothetical protein